MMRTTCLLAFAPIVLVACLQQALAQPLPTIEDIEKVWRSRQERVRSAHFAWTETVLVPKNSRSRDPGPLGPALSGPPEDMTIKLKSFVTFDGDMMHYEETGLRWIENIAELHPQRYASFNDGEAIKSFFEQDRSGRDLFHPSGFIDVGPRYVEAANTALMPVLMNYRPFHPDVQFGDLKPNLYTVADRPGEIDGRACILLEHQNRRTKMWLDPERDFIILRRSSAQPDGRLMAQLDVSYENSGAVGWRPAAWKKIVYVDTPDPADHGIVAKQLDAVVTDHWFNRPIPRSEFQFEFPVGTRVNDGPAGRISYIVRGEGKKRLIHPTEYRADITYADLLSTDSGQAGKPPTDSGESFWS